MSGLNLIIRLTRQPAALDAQSELPDMECAVCVRDGILGSDTKDGSFDFVSKVSFQGLRSVTHLGCR